MDDLPSGSQPIYPSEDEVKSYFTSDDWSSMNSYEKKSYSNILHNYYMMKHFGLNPTKPTFMSLKSQKTSRKRSSGKKHFSPPMKKVCSTSKVEQTVTHHSSDMELSVTTNDSELFNEDIKKYSIELSNVLSAILLVYKEFYESLKNGSDCKNVNEMIKPVTGIPKVVDECNINQLTHDVAAADIEDFGFSDYYGNIDGDKKEKKTVHFENSLPSVAINSLDTDSKGTEDLEDYGFSDYEEEHDKGKKIVHSKNSLPPTSKNDSRTDNKREEVEDYGFSDYDKECGNENRKNKISKGSLPSTSKGILKKDSKPAEVVEVPSTSKGILKKDSKPAEVVEDRPLSHYDEDLNDRKKSQKTFKKEVEAHSLLKSQLNKNDTKKKHHDLEQSTRYPKRSVPVHNYTESELLQDDDYIFCDSCDMEYEGDCPEHGPLTYFADNYTPITGDENRAERTTPGIMKVSKSKIPGAGAGVWTVIGLPLHAKMGPYQGDKSDTPDPLGYSWTIMKNKKVDHYIRASSTVNSNWMRFVNCARHESEQNLMAFQYKGKMYYRTVRRIPPKSELLVWYGKEYAEKLGISLKSFRDPNTAHLTSMVFSCSNCKMTYTSPLYLEKHEKTCYIKDGPRLTVEADKVPTDMTSLGRVSEGRTVYYCPYCKYQTTYSRDIRRHLLTHSGVKPYKCDVCGKAFTMAGNLATHQRIHTGDKPYKCTECCYSCNQKCNLRKHMAARHTGERVYGCSECNYRTVVSFSMTNHMRTHTGDRPYHCPHCEYRASQKGTLAIHMRKHTGERPYHCPHCQYRASYKTNLTSHIARIHK